MSSSIEEIKESSLKLKQNILFTAWIAQKQAFLIIKDSFVEVSANPTALLHTLFNKTKSDFVLLLL